MNKFVKKIEIVSGVMKSFSNKNKLFILCYIGTGEYNVSEILESSNISQSQLSQFLGKMKLEGILESNKRGKEVYYKIKNKKILEIIESLKLIFK